MPMIYKTRLKPKSHSKNQRKSIRSSSGASELKEPAASYFVRNTKVPEFFGQPLAKGERMQGDLSASDTDPRLFYSHPHGEIWLGDSIQWLRSLDAGSVDLVFADPPYNIK